MRRRATAILFNSLSSYVRMGVGFLVGLAITRVALRVLADNPQQSKEIFGTYVLLGSLVGFAAFVNESLQAAIIRFMAIAAHQDNPQRVRQLFSSGWAMNTAVGAVVAGAIAAAGPWLLRYFNIPVALHAQARWAIWLIAGAQLAAAILQPWQAALFAEDRFTLVNAAGLLQQFLILASLAVGHRLESKPARDF